MDPTIDPWSPIPGQQQPVAAPSFMDDPRARAALLSFGLAAMQPPSFADTFTSQLARSIGAGGEAVQRVDDQERKAAEFGIRASEADSKQDLRAAQAENSIARAGAAEARIGTASERLNNQQTQMALRQQQLQQAQERTALGARIKLANMYANYVAATNEENSAGSLAQGKKFVPKPILSQEEWIRNNPMLKQLNLLPPSSADPDSDPSVPPTPAPRSGTPSSTSLQPGTDASTLNPPLPRDPKTRKQGQVYQTPGGVNVKWDGKQLITVD